MRLHPKIKELFLINDTIDLAQNLQLGMMDSSPRLQKTMGYDALKILNGHPNPLKHQPYIIHSEKSYLRVHPNRHNQEGNIIRFGGMRLAGQIGHYTLDRLDDQWMLTLQMFEPKQLSYESHNDQLPARLPEALKLPVAAIVPPFIPYK